MKKVIIDTDPGIDDAIALCYALSHPKLEVLALTSIFGNVSTELATQNALRICELCNTSVPVAQGADSPLHIKRNPAPDFVHGVNGFGNIELPVPTTRRDKSSAAELIIDLVREQPGEITLIPVGPLTNLAKALEQAPDIADKVAEVIVMGGVFYASGNVTPFAEANIWNDPHAAQKVLTASWPVVVHGLDITHQIVFDRPYLGRLAAASPRIGGFLHNAAEFYINFYKEQRNIDGCCPHDLLAVAYAANPQWYKTETGRFDVITDGEQIGRTTTTKVCESNKQIALDVDRTALIDEYFDILGTRP
ncbi:hypothetical protein AB833_05850 [Chromatiales bacterium (ex Bugula neritina AB1)]|nr:hypothetical protein AB833_05850 [Chromatiales bacterium (ex Bugula neritina AB1)]